LNLNIGRAMSDSRQPRQVSREQAEHGQLPVLEARDLFRGGKEICIEHDGVRTACASPAATS